MAVHLKALHTAGSHRAASDSVTALSKLCASEAGLKALAAADWQAALQRLLVAAPNTQVGRRASNTPLIEMLANRLGRGRSRLCTAV